MACCQAVQGGGLRGIPSTTDNVRDQTTRILEALDTATKTLSEINEPGYRDKVLADAVGATASAARSAIDKTSVVLGHSILDEVVTECCQLSAEIVPANWMGFVEDRKVALSEVLQTPAADIARQLLAGFLDQLGREVASQAPRYSESEISASPAIRIQCAAVQV